MLVVTSAMSSSWTSIGMLANVVLYNPNVNLAKQFAPALLVLDTRFTVYYLNFLNKDLTMPKYNAIFSSLALYSSPIWFTTNLELL